MFEKRVKPYHEIAKKYEGEIFPRRRRLSSEDIRQTSMQNCFVLATLLVILAQPEGSDLLRERIVQKGNQSIIKLSDPDDAAKSHYFEVNNVIIHKKNGLFFKDTPLAEHEHLWVYLIEMAIAAMGHVHLHKNHKTVYNFPSHQIVYQSGGLVEFAMQVLTGQSGKSFSITASPNMFQFDILSELAFLSYEALQTNPLLADFILPREIHLEWAKYLKELITKHANLLKNIEKLSVPEAILFLSQSKYPLPAEIMHALQKHLVSFDEHCRIVNSSYASQITGKGYYTKSQVNLFNTLRDYHRAGKLLVIGTKKESSLQEIGLVPGHAYGIEDVNYTVFPQSGKKHLAIRIMNPHGKTGVGVEYKEMGGLKCCPKTGVASFYLDVIDIEKNFQVYYVGSISSPTAELHNTSGVMKRLSLMDSKSEEKSEEKPVFEVEVEADASQAEKNVAAVEMKADAIEKVSATPSVSAVDVSKTVAGKSGISI